MQSALRSATRRAAGITSRRRGVATTTTATATEPGREWVADRASVAALVQQEVRAQMLAEETRRLTRELDRLLAAAEQRPARRRWLADFAWPDHNYVLGTVEGWVFGFMVAAVLFRQ